MDSKQIKQLLERYWQCETTLQEEEQLRDYFCSEEVTEEFQHYKEFFMYQQEEKNISLGKEFDERILAQIEAPVVKACRQTWKVRLMPLFKAAAVVAFVASLGSLVQYSFDGEETLPKVGNAAEKQVLITQPKVQKESEMAQEKHRKDSLLLRNKQRIDNKH